MLSLLTSKVTQWVMGALALAAILGVAAFRLIALGAAKERMKHTERRLEDTLKAKDVRNEVGSLNSIAMRGRLREWSR